MASDRRLVTRYGHYMSSALKSILDENLYCDMELVLATSPLVKVPAHRNVMSAGSAVLKRTLRRMAEEDPDKAVASVPLPGGDIEIVCHIVDFIYTGHADVSSDQLDEFIELAKYLEVHGLMDPNSNLPMISLASDQQQQQQPAYADDNTVSSNVIVPSAGEVPQSSFSGVRALKGGGGQCIDCGKIFSQLCNCKRHYVTKHLPAVEITCHVDKCKKTFKNRVNWAAHMANVHKLKQSVLQSPSSTKAPAAAKITKPKEGKDKNSEPKRSKKTIKKEEQVEASTGGDEHHSTKRKIKREKA